MKAQLQQYCLLLLFVLSAFSMSGQLALDTFPSKLYNTEKNFSFPDIFSSIITDNGYIYLGMYSHGLLRINDDSYKYFKLDETTGRHDDRVFCLYEDPEKKLWIGDEVGLQYFDQKRELFHSKAKAFFAKAHPYLSSVWAMHKTDENTMLLGTKAGLLEYDIAQDSIIGKYLEDDVVIGLNSTQHHIMNIKEDAQNNEKLWIVGNTYLYSFNNITKEIEQIDCPFYGEQEALMEELFQYKHMLYIIANKGYTILSYNTQNGDWRKVHSEEVDFYLSGKYKSTYGVRYLGGQRITEQYVLIMSRETGPRLFDLENEEMIQLYLKNPLFSEITNFEHSSNLIDHYLKHSLWALVDKNGYLNAGHVREVYTRTESPILKEFMNNDVDYGNIKIEQVFVNNTLSPKAEIINENDIFSFKKYQRDLGFRFRLANPAFSDIAYQYKLDESGAWSKPIEGNLLNFTNVVGGNHKLHLRAKRDDRIVSERVVDLNIEKHWYEKWINRIFILIGFTSLLYLLYKYREKQIREKEGLEKKLANVEMAALRAQMNPHFLFNGLNSINQYIVTEEPQKASDYLVKFSRLMRNILNNSKKQTVSLEDELATLKLYMDIENLRYGQMFSYTIDIDEKLDTKLVHVPPLLLQPYVENSIRHGFTNLKDRKGKLQIKINKTKEGLGIELIDNGVGINEAMRINEKKLIRKESFGMDITQDRIKLINEIYNIQTDVEVSDVLDNDGKVLGTKINLCIPEIKI